MAAESGRPADTTSCAGCVHLRTRLEALRLTFEGHAVHLRASTHRINAAAPEAQAWESAAYKLFVALYGDLRVDKPP